MKFVVYRGKRYYKKRIDAESIRKNKDLIYYVKNLGYYIVKRK